MNAGDTKVELPFRFCLDHVMPLASNKWAVLSRSDIRNLGVLTNTAPGDQVQSLDVGLCRRNDNISIRANAVNDASATLKAHSHFTLGIGATGNIIHRVQLEVAT